MKTITDRHHGLGPLAVAPLKYLDALQVSTDLHQVPNTELLTGAGLAAHHHAPSNLSQHSRVECPPEGHEVVLDECCTVLGMSVDAFRMPT